MAIAALWEALDLFPLILAIGLSLHFPVIGWSLREDWHIQHTCNLACVFRYSRSGGSLPDERLTLLPLRSLDYLSTHRRRSSYLLILAFARNITRDCNDNWAKVFCSGYYNSSMVAIFALSSGVSAAQEWRRWGGDLQGKQVFAYTHQILTPESCFEP